MLFYFVYLLSSVLILSRLLQPWSKETGILSPVVWKKFFRFSMDRLKISSLVMAFRSNRKVSFATEGQEHSTTMSLLDLPDPMLEIILSKLSPHSLCIIAAVCCPLRQICFSDQIWESHLNQKWNRLIWHNGAKRAWDSYISLGNDRQSSGERSLSFKGVLPWMQSKFSSRSHKISKPLTDSHFNMKWYSALECGKFRLPAQVFNRENGHAGFMLSCYDAELCYDRLTDTFCARYPPNGRRMAVVESGVEWDRVRAPPMNISGQDIYISECLEKLRPGDHVEIQWRRSKEFSYGWWYGVIGHLEFCHGDVSHCRCCSSENVVVEFKQYSISSQWRQTIVNRRGHLEEGDETNGFYGGLRRLQEEEIATWRRLWPGKTMD